MNKLQAPAIELGPDGKEWAKTKAGYEHVGALLLRADGATHAPYWHGWALREAFVAGAVWQEQRAKNNPALQPNQGQGNPGIFAPQAMVEDWTVDRFAVVMKEKLAQARAKGRSGWNMPACTQQELSNALREHVEKGDPRDVANFRMFLWARREAIAAAPQAAPAAFVSPAQLAALKDPKDQSGQYLPTRKTPAGQFTLALYAAPQAAPHSARLTKPAKVGGGTFCTGVPERLVIEAAQRLHEHEASEPKASPEELMTQELARRNLWDMVHGPLPTAGNHPALPTRPQVADALLAEVSGNFTRDDDLPNDLLRRIDAYLTSEGYTE